MMKTMRVNSDKIFMFCIYAIMLILLILFLYPLYFTVIASFSEPKYVATGQVTFLPKGFSLKAYAEVFHAKDIWLGYANSLYYTVGGTLFNLF